MQVNINVSIIKLYKLLDSYEDPITDLMYVPIQPNRIIKEAKDSEVTPLNMYDLEQNIHNNNQQHSYIDIMQSSPC